LRIFTRRSAILKLTGSDPIVDHSITYLPDGPLGTAVILPSMSVSDEIRAEYLDCTEGLMKKW
jgi:hypothetical protein